MRRVIAEMVAAIFDATLQDGVAALTVPALDGSLIMTHDWPLYACLCLALWSAIVGGVFSAFSEFVMRGLLRAEPAGGIEAMQHINRTVLKTQFVAGILLIGPMAIAMAVYAGNTLDGVARAALIAAPVVYVPTVFLMTLFGNVPMNNRLDRLDHRAQEAVSYWQTYGRDWTRLNHVRTLGSLVTAGVYLIAAINLVG
ncbi:MAG: anthrone oxygenase family protein [Pseudomonadota bacterium]